MTTTSLSATLTAAIAAQDGAAIAACFADHAEFLALTPPGLRERSGATEIAALIEGWFADSTELELVEETTAEVADRLHISYRLQGIEEGEAFTVEQQLYCSVEAGRITRGDLLCSGFRRRVGTRS